MQQDSQAMSTCHHAVITGGGRGIGAAIAEALASRGAAISLIGRNGTHGSQMVIAAADVSDPAAVQAAMTHHKNELGAPTVLVDNAGIAPSSPFIKATTAFWRKVLDVDLMGTVYCAQAALPDMLEAGWGRIVNVASTAGKTGLAYITAYCAAKRAVVGLTRALAIETARSRGTVNAICPGYTDTDIIDVAVGGITSKTGRSRKDVIATLVAQNPQRRLIRPDEVADTVVSAAIIQARSPDKASCLPTAS